MGHLGQPGRAEIIAFPTGRSAATRFTLEDRLEICRWAAALRRCGSDRLVIHERLPSDPPELGDYLSIYRAGQVWACCGIARQRGRILAWCSATGQDTGPFATLREALQAMLPLDVAALPEAVEAWTPPPAQVRSLPQRVRLAAVACAD